MPRKRAAIYLSGDTSRPGDDGQIFAEVVAHPNTDAEEILYTTTWYVEARLALKDAAAWMKASGVEED